MPIIELVKEFSLLEGLAIPKSVKQASKLLYRSSCGRKMTDVGLREKTRNGAKGANFIRFRLRTTLGSSEHSCFFLFGFFFCLRTLKAVGAAKLL